jgi:hypothetical protein
MRTQILIAMVAAAVVSINGHSAVAGEVPQYQAAGFPITPLQMSVLKPSARTSEQQGLNAQRAMDAARAPVIEARDFGIASQR